MSVDWKYIYKRRGWSMQHIFNSLDEKTWENFESFHSSRGIQVPPKSDFDLILSSYQKPKPKASPEPVKKETKKPAKRKRTYTRKKKE